MLTQTDISRMSESDFQQLKNIVENVPEVKFICLDVANGYSQVSIFFFVTDCGEKI
jgi:GMP reductase